MPISLSYSAAQKYLLSPMSYFLHYIMKLRPVDRGSALAFGAAVDEGLNELLRQKQNNEEINVEAAKAIFCVQWQSVLDDEEIKYTKADADESLLTQLDISSGLPVAWCSLNRKGQILIEEYAAQVIPRLKQVILIQHDIALKNEAGDAFVGKIDLVAVFEDGKTYIFDNKTSTVSYDDDAASNSEQLATYYEALNEEFKLDGIGYIVIPKKVRKKKLPRVEIKIQTAQIKEEVIEKTFHDYDKVLHGIKTGKFPCSGKCKETPWGCAYQKYCDSDGHDLTGLEYKK